MAKKSAVKVMFICLLLLVTICFSACSEVRAMTVLNDDGTVDELVYISLDEGTITSSGYTMDEIKTKVENVSVREAQAIINQFKFELAQDILLSTDETRKILASYQDGIEILYLNEWENNTFVVGLRFKNADVYRYYYNMKNISETKVSTEEHFLYDKIYYSSSSMFADYSALYNKIYDEIISEYPNFINQENKLLYTYVTDSRREHSDADYITNLNGEYYHTWEVEPNNISTNVTFYYNVLNRANCIIVCIGTTILVSGILLLIGYIVEKRKNKKFKEKI